MFDDKIIYEIVNKLYGETKNWLEYVDSIGNQCATTDRKIENIIELVDTLKMEYSKL